MVLRLYEAATDPEGPDTKTIVRYMPDIQDGLVEYHTSVRQLHGRAPDQARTWA